MYSPGWQLIRIAADYPRSDIMDFITPSLCYQIVILDRACIAVDARLERLKRDMASLLAKQLSEEQLAAIKLASDEITVDLTDIKLSAQSVATPVNDAISRLALGESGDPIIECVAMAAEHFKYSTARFMMIDAKLDNLRKQAEL